MHKLVNKVIEIWTHIISYYVFNTSTLILAHKLVGVTLGACRKGKKEEEKFRVWKLQLLPPVATKPKKFRSAC